MSLKGNLKDVSISNVLQMICFEKKGGILSVTSGDKFVSFYFEEGKIIHAEQSRKYDETFIEKISINNQFLTKIQWDQILKECERSLQPLWIPLYSCLENNTPIFLLLRQRYIEQVIFNLLQWER